MSSKSLICSIIFCFLFCSELLAQPQEHTKKNEIKVALLSLASGTSKITYEHLVKAHQSIELTAGIIGLGFDRLKDSNPKGTAWRAAYKFIHPNRMADCNPLNGFYLKPELAFSSYSYDYTRSERLRVNRLALMGCIGYDWVLDWFVFDVYGGLGGAVGNCNKSNYHHGFIGWKDLPLAFTAGFRVGVAF